MKTVLITGGTRGIGLGIARALVADGFHLAVNGMRPPQQVVKTIEELRAIGNTEVLYCQGNIGSSLDREKILSEVFARFSTINFLINNAGVAPKQRADLLDMTEESYDRVMDINLKGPFFFSQMMAKKMIEFKNVQPNEHFAIINMSSISATLASPERGQYCLSKAGMAMMTQLFAVRLGVDDIPVYEIRPGVISTDMTSGVKGKYNKLIEEGLCLQKRWGTPEDVGKAVAALTKGDFPYSTGQVFMVDGGLTVRRL